LFIAILNVKGSTRPWASAWLEKRLLLRRSSLSCWLSLIYDHPLLTDEMNPSDLGLCNFFLLLVLCTVPPGDALEIGKFVCSWLGYIGTIKPAYKKKPNKPGRT
jgi:hypothetical protein